MQVKLYDSKWAMSFNDTIANAPTSINLKGLDIGIYFLTLEKPLGESQKPFKILKQ